MGFLEIFIVLPVLIVSIVYLIFQNAFSYWQKRGIPYETPIIPYGNAKGTNKKFHHVDLMQRFYEKFKKEAPLCGIYFFLRPVGIITDLNLIKSILIGDFNYFTDRGLYYNEKDDPLSAHLFNLDGPQWKFLRTKLSPTFTSGKMKFMFPTILEVGVEFEKCITKMIETNAEIEMKDVLARFTTDVIGTCAFGIDCNSLNDANAEFRVRGRELFVKTRHGPFARALILSFPKIARFLKVKMTRDVQSKFFMRVVKETVDYREQNGIRRNDFMDLLLEMKNGTKNESGLSLGEIAAQSFVFFIAGFETSSTTMGFCIYELAKNPKVQEKLRKEVQEVLAKHDGQFSYEAMTEMTYMEQTINETLRKYPPVPSLFRKAIKHYPVKGTKYFIEKDTSLFIPVHSIHHDPDLYPNPEEFNPDRFSPEEWKNRHPCAFLPFGDGPRNCIGLRFGKMQTRVGLTVLLKSFKFSMSPSTQSPLKLLNKSFILNPEFGVNLIVEKLS